LKGVRRHGYTLLGYITWHLVWRERVRAHVRRGALGAGVLAVAVVAALVARRGPEA